MARIRILRGVWYKGQPLAEGQDYDVDDFFAASVVSDGRAARTPRDVVEVREPEVRHRDPVVRRGAR